MQTAWTSLHHTLAGSISLHSFWITTAPTSPASAMVAEESDSVEGGNAVTRWKGVERMSGREL
jgi:hypothetical protein